LIRFARSLHRNGVTCSLALFFVMLFIFAYAMLTIERYQDDMSERRQPDLRATNQPTNACAQSATP
jgi:hypothetical protein